MAQGREAIRSSEAAATGLAASRGSVVVSVLAVLIALLLPGRALCQPDSGRLEEKLVEATGRERLELLVELTTQDRKRESGTGGDLGHRGARHPRPGERRSTASPRCSIPSALAYLAQSQHRECLPYAEESAHLARASGDKAALAEALSVLGSAHLNLTEIDRALVESQRGDPPQRGAWRRVSPGLFADS